MYKQWVGLLEALVDRGDSRSPRKLPTKEFLGVKFKVESGLDNILYHPERKMNYRFAVAEWLWIMSGSNNLETIARYNSKIRDFSDDGDTLFGAYGPRIMPQIPWLLEKLKESDTRQAVVSIWKPTPPASKDIPCTVSLQFLRRDSTINLIVSMRSSDIWLGLPYDFYTFSQILNCVCGVMNCRVGFVQFNLGSSHLYQSNLEQAMRLLNDYASGKTFVSLGSPGMPPEYLLKVLIDPSLSKDHYAPSIAGQYWERYVKVLIGASSESLSHLTT